MGHVALSYQLELHPVFEEAIRRGLISAMEIVPEGFSADPVNRERFARVIDQLGLPLSFHLISNSLGSADFRENNDIHFFREFLKGRSPIQVSDHMTCSRAGDVNLEMNLPMLRTEETLELFIENIGHFKREMGLRCPFLLENISSLWDFKASTLTIAEFYREAVLRSDSFFLLDVHNLYADELNLKADPIAFIDSLPADRIREIHIAGGHWAKGAYFDSHSQGVPARVFELLEYALRRSDPALVVLEREANFTDFDRIHADLTEVKRIWTRARERSSRKFSEAA